MEKAEAEEELKEALKVIKTLKRFNITYMVSLILISASALWSINSRNKADEFMFDLIEMRGDMIDEYMDFMKYVSSDTSSVFSYHMVAKYIETNAEQKTILDQFERRHEDIFEK